MPAVIIHWDKHTLSHGGADADELMITADTWLELAPCWVCDVLMAPPNSAVKIRAGPLWPGWACSTQRHGTGHEVPASFLQARWLIDTVLGSQLSCDVVPSPLQAGYVAQQGEVTLSKLCHEVEGTCRVPADALPDAMSGTCSTQVGLLRSKQLAQVF